MLRRVLDVCWSEWFWLPPYVTWKDMENGSDKKYVYAEMNDIWYQIPLTISLLVLRLCMEKYVFLPLGKSLGVPDKKIRKPPSNAILEAAYKSSERLCGVYGLAKQVDMSEREVQRWWRLRRSQDKTSKLVKFCETSWKTTFLVLSVTFGLYNLIDKDWFWNIDIIFISYPHHNYTRSEWWYYMLNTSFYWSLLITHFRDVRHKDFWQMFAHHLLVIVLLVFTWTSNFYRLGLWILPLQDSSELLLQLTKSSYYTKFENITYGLYILFVTWWFVERIYIYPVFFMWPIFSRGLSYVRYYPFAILGFIGLLCIMILHLWWSWLIIIMTRKVFKNEKVHDVRSSASEISDADNMEGVDEITHKK